MKRYKLIAGATTVIARAVRAAEEGKLDGVSTETIGKMAEMLTTLTPQEQFDALQALAKALGITLDGKPVAKPSPDPNVVTSRTRAQLVAREGELDVAAQRVLARMGGETPNDHRGEWSPHGTRVLAGGRVQLSVLRGARGSARLEEDGS